MDIRDEHFAKILREVAALEPNLHIRNILHTRADDIIAQITMFEGKPSLNNLMNLVAAYTRGWNAFKASTPNVPNNPNAGRLSLPQAA